MSAKLHLILSVFGLLGILTACSPAVPVNLATPTLSQSVEMASTPEVTEDAQPSPLPLRFDCQDSQEISMQECQALVTLYEATNGDAWEDNSGWLVNQTPCSWYGVICQQGHVIELQLFYNHLAGSVPREIRRLTYLKGLYLDSNQLNGPVPAEIGNLTELQVLRLGDNHFNSLPAELASLNNLLELDLSRNQFSGTIPGELGNLSNLQRLSLRSNGFTGDIPPELGQLGNLTHLDLANNQLSGSIPGALGDLVMLNELHLAFNQLTGSIPAEFGKLTKLYWLDLSYNQLTGDIPSELGEAPIAEFRLWGNLLEGTIPASGQPVTKVEYRGIQYEFDSALAESVWPEVRPPQPLSPESPAWEVRPQHVRFTFARPRELSQAELGGAGPGGQPQILIYPAKEFSTISEPAAEEIKQLQSLLKARPPDPENEIPVLPLINAAQVFHAQVKYLDFQNGGGVRFITQYSQDISPITNQALFYTFQGLTKDGAYYVAAYFPIDAAGLTDEPAITDWDAFSAGYQGYLKQTISQLDTLSSADFEPDLEILDDVIQSLAVNTP